MMKITHASTDPYYWVVIDMADMRLEEQGEVQPNSSDWATGETWKCFSNGKFGNINDPVPSIFRSTLDCPPNREMCRVKVRRRR